MCESPTERPKNYSSNQLLVEPISTLIMRSGADPGSRSGFIKEPKFWLVFKSKNSEIKFLVWPFHLLCYSTNLMKTILLCPRLKGNEKALRQTQTLLASCSKSEPKKISPRRRPPSRGYGMARI